MLAQRFEEQLVIVEVVGDQIARDFPEEVARVGVNRAEDVEELEQRAIADIAEERPVQRQVLQDKILVGAELGFHFGKQALHFGEALVGKLAHGFADVTLFQAPPDFVEFHDALPVEEQAVGEIGQEVIEVGGFDEKRPGRHGLRANPALPTP